MDLTYKVTAFANTVEDEHRLLARALVTFLKNPLIPDEVMHSSLAGEEIPTEVASTSPNQGLAEYWGAMSNDARPSLDYRVTTRIDLSQEIEVGLALTSRLISRQVEGPTATGHVEVSPLRIGGKLHRTGDPDAGIASARLTLVERGLDTTTDSLGRFIFSGVPAGTYTVSVQSPDIYEEIRTTLQVPGQNYDIAI